MRGSLSIPGWGNCIVIFRQCMLLFSAECTIGMVWGLTALKHYGNKALKHYGTMTIRCKL